MKDQLRIDVEPLSDQRWDRIERSLMQRAEQEAAVPQLRGSERSPLRARVWLAAAAVLCTLAIVVLQLAPSAEHARVDQSSRITTGATASHLALPGLSLDVEPDSAVVVGAETTQGLLIVLDRGTVVCSVAPRPTGAPLIVQAGAVQVRVVGTRFSVTRIGEVARVEVSEGVVEVKSAGRSSRVGTGEEWSSAVLADAPAESEPADSDENAGDEPSPVSEVAHPSLAEAARGRADAQEGATAKGERAARPSSTSAAKASDPTKEPESSKASDAEPETTPQASSQSIFEQATALERSDPARASRLYRQLESRGDSWASNALYARGRLAASRGNSVEARRVLELYLRRFPRGSNAEDARAVLRKLR